MTSILDHIQQQRPFDTLEEEVFVGLQLAANRLMEPWARYLRESADLTEVQYNVLRILRGASPVGLRVQELACRLIARSPDVTRLIDRLAGRSLVDRRPDPEDGRAVRVHITANGLARLKPLDDQARAMLGVLLGGVDRGKLELLRDVLEEVLDGVQGSNDVGTDSRSAAMKAAGKEIG